MDFLYETNVWKNFYGIPPIKRGDFKIEMVIQRFKCDENNKYKRVSTDTYNFKGIKVVKNEETEMYEIYFIDRTYGREESKPKKTKIIIPNIEKYKVDINVLFHGNKIRKYKIRDNIKWKYLDHLIKTNEIDIYRKGLIENISSKDVDHMFDENEKIDTEILNRLSMYGKRNIEKDEKTDELRKMHKGKKRYFKEPYEYILEHMIFYFHYSSFFSMNKDFHFKEQMKKKFVQPKTFDYQNEKYIIEMHNQIKKSEKINTKKRKKKKRRRKKVHQEHIVIL